MNQCGTEEHDLHRMDDDGGCVLPIRIGIAPATADAKPRLILGPSVAPIGGDAGPPTPAGVTGESPTSLDWPGYLAWRKTKTPPRDAARVPPPPADAPAADKEAWMRSEYLEEIDQATHELVGEVAELGELLIAHGPNAFFGELRDRLLDEIGDIFFCGAWALDAWGKNPLADVGDDLELLRVADDSDLAAFAGILAAHPAEAVASNARFISALGGAVFRLMLEMQTCAGLTANAFKKLKFQRREQDVDTQVGRIASALLAANQVLVIANSSVEEALLANRKKLDARFPEGYRPGVGGGIRTGDGK